MAVMGTNYAWFNGGDGGNAPQTTTTTAPTQAQAYNFNQLNCILTAADADTTCTITHNFNLTAAQQTNLLPNISYIENNDSTGTVYPVLKFVVSTNTIAVTKLNTVAGSQGSYLVTINRPWSPTL